MKKNLLLYNLTLFIFFSPLFRRGAGGEAFSQNPLVKQWDYRFGGTDEDQLHSFRQTSEGGYILGGYSKSGISGDKTQIAWGGSDYWIIKIDSLGNKEWDKNFGSTSYDVLRSLQQTADGGYILGGNSEGGINGDKTQASWGFNDFWVIKVNSLGIKQWDKDFGGTSHDVLYSLKQTSDQGYILGGWSISGISGNKTEASWGNYDFWIVKTDSLGNKQWDKDFGGTNGDLLNSLQQTSDGGYILGGISSSPVSGNKTQPTWGGTDYWIVKIDALGNKEWDKDFGGTSDDELYSLQQTADGGYILGGKSRSPISGDKTQASWGNFDYWIVKIDSMGNKQWDKDFGGTSSEDSFGNIFQTSDAGYLAAGSSYSYISGDKTENNLGGEQSWIVKTDSLGNKQWDKTLHTTVYDDIGYAIETKDKCFAMANYTYGGIGGDKTQPSWLSITGNPTTDYWLIKFCDTTLTTSINQLPDYPNTFSIYPNPANEYVTINYHFKAGDEIRLTDVLGKLLFTTKITVPTLNFKLQTLNLSTGIYFLKAGNEVRKFVKE